ncbi:MAG: NADH-quinone oxidoreductase subunit A [Endomicrobiaceae bacterium]|jgi:NADH-quinone oxidoreductase subunit A|nr:NADH-quinone oxidoreductase subunit A [Endomicrobiaceae bacterium]MDD3730284.1 NADH-quinone oxidoreductase subunit A [Endomicrobiaceae bacterium]MDD4166472.1 NADH-quinone oxidoreductase subunit A [Endomicrobiaceae bacterium]
MQNIFITPPVIVIFIAIIVTVVFLLLSKLSYKSGNNPKGKFKAYSCGEEPAEERRKPSYTRFFPFAFFFTIMHVVVLLIATVPVNIKSSLVFVLLFIVISFISIPILFREED